MFRIPPISLRDPRELAAYAVLGLVGGFASLLFARSLAFLRPRLRRQSPALQMLQPAVAGLLVGGIGYFGLPQIMGAGYTAIDQAMHGQFTWKLLLLLAFFKIIATTLSFASGTPGGMFAPTLFTGAMLGAAVGAVETALVPHVTGPVGAYALVGMGVLFAAFLRAPLTSVFMVLEVSGNYSIVLPVILANTIAYLISRALQPVPVFELLTQQDGLDLPSMEEQREESNFRLEDALQTLRSPVIEGSEPVGSALELLQRQSPSDFQGAVLVRCAGNRWYAARLGELVKLLREQRSSADTLEEALPADRTPLLYPDLPLASALPFLGRWPMLPISNRAQRGRLEGVISLDDVLQNLQHHAS